MSDEKELTSEQIEILEFIIVNSSSIDDYGEISSSIKILQGEERQMRFTKMAQLMLVCLML